MKEIFLKTVIALIFIVVIDASFFVYYDMNTCADSVWAAFIGVNIAYLSLYLIPIFANKERGLRILNNTLYLIGGFYIYTELFVVGMFLIWMEKSKKLPLVIQWIQDNTEWTFVTRASIDSPKLIIIVQLILFGIYIITLAANILANEATSKSIAQQNAESDKIRMLANEAYEVCQLVKTDKNAYKQATLCYDDIKASPLHSTPEVSTIEEDINSALLEMRIQAQEGKMEELAQTALRIRQLISKRNFRLKNNRNY
jgi:cell division protein FtsB